MKRVFADTHFWIALTNPAEADHALAIAARDNLRATEIHTSEEVLSEFLTYMSSGGADARLYAVAVVRKLLANPKVRVHEQSHETFARALELYEARPDKGYSIVDCASMAQMRRNRIADVLTRDRHFAQEGFNVLIKA